MAGTKKSKRVSAGTRTKTNPNEQRMAVSILHNNRIAIEEKFKHQKLAHDALLKIVQGKGELLDWTHVHYRITAGLYYYKNFFQDNEDVDLTIASGFDMLTVVFIRNEFEQKFSIMQTEWDIVMAALVLTDDFMRDASLWALKEIYKVVTEQYDVIEEDNWKASSPEEIDKKLMAKVLGEEYAQANPATVH
jgi:hypothetical protein